MRARRQHIPRIPRTWSVVANGRFPVRRTSHGHTEGEFAHSFHVVVLFSIVIIVIYAHISDDLPARRHFRFAGGNREHYSCMRHNNTYLICIGVIEPFSVCRSLSRIDPLWNVGRVQVSVRRERSTFYQ